ncbi:beta-phosphoglucomutase [Paenibacillus gallinarum]|uniref:Beta-phosphoglucomutase n=1 Tax=Paenibacillus gallinarum TaxID=2762232 RepID=A0ABR8STH0_9BACL|nr:beta-phosphoglucomutase [Paenibacillus gallinarum]MBD7966790.1 beta-phosphoglucomutase [Paenibacillus gallinarum]
MKAVIFDLDGVITDTAEYHYLAWKSLADELDLPFDKEFNEKLKGVSRMESLELILSLGDAAYSDEEKNALAEKKNDLYKEMIQKVTPADLLPGIEALLKELQEAGIGIALASASKNAPFILDRLGVTHYFNHVVDVNLIKQGKPDPEIFLTGAAKLGVLPEDCVGIEDAEAGIESILSAGMYAVGVGNPAQMQKADLIVSSTAELSLSLLKENFKQKTK